MTLPAEPRCDAYAREFFPITPEDKENPMKIPMINDRQVVESAREAIEDFTYTVVLDALGIDYFVNLPDEGGVDIHIYEQVIEQD